VEEARKNRIDNEDGVRKEENEKDKSIIGANIKYPAPMSWDDIILDDLTKEKITTEVHFPLQFPVLCKSNIATRVAFLFYGPPGTGKTFVASSIAATYNTIATSSGKKQMSFFEYSASSIMQKWVGDSERHVREIFETAILNRPSVSFIDECDCFMGKRDSSDDGTGSLKRVQSELLTQFNALAGNPDVIVVCATNLPNSLDDGMLRRMTAIKMPMPTQIIRDRLLTLWISKMTCKIYADAVSRDAETGLPLSPQEIGDFVENSLLPLTDGYSHADINSVVGLFDKIPRQRVIRATHFKPFYSSSFSSSSSSGEKEEEKEKEENLKQWIPCSSDTEGAVKLTWSSINDDRALAPFVAGRVTTAEILQAFATYKPNGPTADMRPIDDFERKYAKISEL
jgi:SpoVK/Ycf46/Vps4 family AAA+-type ATPase